MVNRQSWIALVFRVRGGILLCLCGVKCRFSEGAKYRKERTVIGYYSFSYSKLIDLVRKND